MRSFAIATTLLASLAAVPAMAQPGPGHFRHGGGPLLEGVTLSDAQQNKVDALRQAGRTQNRATFEQLRAVHEQIDAALLGSGSVTEATLAPLLQQQEALQDRLEQARLTEQLAIRNILTPDQLGTAAATHAKLASLHDQEHALMARNATGGGASVPPPPAD
ncbi:MAG: periplasmic heavy metal sensor [Gluconacetobacter diazotrophicus]|nr:periplasmic heavy metal sensor [Gluconacetobacter diazotrophicus]